MVLIADSVMQKLKVKREKNFKIRRKILNRKGSLDVTDPEKVQAHVDELKKKKPIPQEKILTPLEKLEKKKAARKKAEDKKTKKIKVKAKKVAVKKVKKVKKVSTANMVKVTEAPPKIEKIALYVPFAKVDKEKKLVSGIATSEAIDSYGDIVRTKAIKKALPDYLEFSNIREMHGPSAVGTIKEHDLNMKKKYLHITVKVVDDNAWAKVVEEVYKGFSIGGRTTKAEPLKVKVPVEYIVDGEVDEKILQSYADGVEVVKEEQEYLEVYTGGYEILELELIEISLVDRPACPEALIDSFKSRNKVFIPDRAFVFKNTGKVKKELTSKSKLHNLATSLQSSQNTYKTLNSLAYKFTMSKKKQMAKALTAVLKFLEKRGVDLSDGVVDKAGSVSVNRRELRDVVEIAIEKSLEVTKGEGDDEDEKSDEEDSKSKDTDESGSAEDEESEENDDANEGESDDEEAEEDKDDDDDDDDDDKDEKDEKEEDAESDDDEKDKDEGKDLEKTLKKVLKPFVEGLSDLSTEVKQIKKTATATSTQKGENSEEADENNSDKIFRGVFH